MSASLDIVIVNWNTGNALRDCLLSISAVDGTVISLRNVVLIDNASTDNSMSGVDEIGLPITLIRNSRNEGFAKACNQGALLCQSDYLLFLNPDTRITSGSLAEPLAYLERLANASVGICGVGLIGIEGRPAICCGRFPTARAFLVESLGLHKLWPRVFHDRLTRADRLPEHGLVDQVIGAFFLVRRQLFELLDGFDERFFMYFEEVDFSLRAKAAGFSSVLLMQTTAFHLGAGSTSQVKSRRLYYLVRSRMQYAAKHFATAEFLLLILVTATVEPFTRLAWSCWQAGFPGVRNTLAAYRDFYAWLLQTYMIDPARPPRRAVGSPR